MTAINAQIFHNKNTFLQISNLIILSLIFIFWPFLAFVISILFISRKQHVFFSNLICFLFFGLYGFTFLPNSSNDITRHYMIFDSLLSVYTIQDFVITISSQENTDPGISVIYWGLGRFIKNFQIVGFIGASFYYGALLISVEKWCSNLIKENNKLKYSVCFLLTLFSLFSLVRLNEFNGMRQSIAMGYFFIIITSNNFYFKSKIFQFCVLAVSFLIHFSMFPIVILYLVATKLNLRKDIMIAIVISLLSLLVIPIMSTLMNVLPIIGSTGIAIANKINDYIFSDTDITLFSGSRLRFFLIIFLIIIYPFVFLKIIRSWVKINNYQKSIFLFSILIFGYIIFMSQTYVVSRIMPIFKILMIFILSYITFQPNFNIKVRNKFKLSMYLIAFLGLVFIFQAREYRNLNTKIFYSSLPSLINEKTKIEGYSLE